MNRRPEADGFVRWLNDPGCTERAQVGAKAANLARIVQSGFRSPAGFCVTTAAFDQFLTGTSVIEKLTRVLAVDRLPSRETALIVADLLDQPEFPSSVRRDVIRAYRALLSNFGHDAQVAVRSSATVEDSATASFAGQFDSFLGVVGEDELIDVIARCWRSCFGDRVIAYSRRHKLDIDRCKMAVIVQRMVPATAAGVMFTINPNEAEPNSMVIEAARGTGTVVVSGSILPEMYVIDKSSFRTLDHVGTLGRHALGASFGRKRDAGASADWRDETPLLSQNLVLELARIGIELESLFGTPQDVEWALEGDSIQLLQSRPVSLAGELREVGE